jgi:VanZ family protein
LPVIIWMAIIFSASTDLLSSDRTSRFIGPILRWFNPDISEAAIRRVQLVARKGAHVTEYAILAALLWRAIRLDPRRWSWGEAGLAVGFAALYAVTDELHQHFVASRYGTVGDVVIDTAGAILGVTIVWAAGRARNRW